MISTTLPALPTQPGAYRWFYVDAGFEDWTAVAIFMVGAQFSWRYSVGAERGEAPQRHCAVNFALYKGGRRRAWVFSEFDGARHEKDTLRIGDSWFSVAGGKVVAHVDARQAPFGERVVATLALDPIASSDQELVLVPGQPHRWQAVVPRAVAAVAAPGLGAVGAGHGYHDTNCGDAPLGEGLQGWEWSRAHGEDATEIQYRPFGAKSAIDVRASARGVEIDRRPLPALERRQSAWGLSVPRAGRALESSPFYARLEERTEAQHILREVADFGRFHSPWIRWMARFRSRAEAAG